jgi:hypothetical protein
MRTTPGRRRFKVTDQAELADRGAFVLGKIIDGVVRPGMRVKTHLEPPALTISGVEFLDNVAERRHLNALVFAEHPTLNFVAHGFPVA